MLILLRLRLLWQRGLTLVGLGFGILLSPHRAHGQRADTPHRTLDQLYADVAATNPRVMAAAAMVRAGEARVGPVRHWPDPTVQVSAMGFGVPGLTPMPGSGGVTLQLMQMIPTAGKTKITTQIAETEVSIEGLKGQVTWLEVRASALGLWAALWGKEQELIITRSILGTMKGAALGAENMYRAGSGRQSEILRAQMAIIRMNEDTLAMQGEIKALQQQLRALGAWVPGQAGDFKFVTAELPTDSAMVSSLALSPMVRLESVRTEEATARVRLGLAERRPDISVGMSLGRVKSIDGMGTETMVGVMVETSLPIYRHDRQNAMVREAEAMRTAAELMKRSATLELTGKVMGEAEKIKKIKLRQRLYETVLLPRADAAIGATEVEYGQGKRDLGDVLEGIVDRAKLRQNLVRMRVEEIVALAEIEVVLGQTLVTGEIYE